MSNAETTMNSETEARRNKVQSWLMEEGWRIGLHDIPETSWALACQDGSGRHITIVQEASRKDRIIITSGLNVAPEHQQRLNHLPEKQRKELIFELRQNFLLLGVGYAGIVEPLTRIFFDQRIYDDGLTKDAFLQRMSRVRDASIMAINIIARYLAEPPPPPEERHIGFSAQQH